MVIIYDLKTRVAFLSGLVREHESINNDQRGLQHKKLAERYPP
jgi:hypothetical protein